MCTMVTNSARKIKCAILVCAKAKNSSMKCSRFIINKDHCTCTMYFTVRQLKAFLNVFSLLHPNMAYIHFLMMAQYFGIILVTILKACLTSKTLLGKWHGLTQEATYRQYSPIQRLSGKKF